MVFFNMYNIIRVSTLILKTFLIRLTLQKELETIQYIEQSSKHLTTKHINPLQIYFFAINISPK